MFWDDWFSSDNSVGASAGGDDFGLGGLTGWSGREQEQLGQGIVDQAIAGWNQEELGRGIVQESIGQNLVDSFLAGTTQVEPWLRTLDGTLGTAARTIGQVDRLLGRTQTLVSPGGLAREIQQSARAQPILDTVRRYVNVYPPANATLGSPARPAATFTGTVGSMDYLTIGGMALGAFLLYKLVR
jgi:hypothetical protein